MLKTRCFVSKSALLFVYKQCRCRSLYTTSIAMGVKWVFGYSSQISCVMEMMHVTRWGLNKSDDILKIIFIHLSFPKGKVKSQAYEDPVHWRLSMHHNRPISLIRINVNPSMGKQTHARWINEWHHPPVPNLQRLKFGQNKSFHATMYNACD